MAPSSSAQLVLFEPVVYLRGQSAVGEGIGLNRFELGEESEIHRQAVTLFSARRDARNSSRRRANSLGPGVVGFGVGDEDVDWSLVPPRQENRGASSSAQCGEAGASPSRAPHDADSGSPLQHRRVPATLVRSLGHAAAKATSALSNRSREPSSSRSRDTASSVPVTPAIHHASPSTNEGVSCYFAHPVADGTTSAQNLHGNKLPASPLYPDDPPRYDAALADGHRTSESQKYRAKHLQTTEVDGGLGRCDSPTPPWVADNGGDDVLVSNEAPDPKSNSSAGHMGSGGILSMQGHDGELQALDSAAPDGRIQATNGQTSRPTASTNCTNSVRFEARGLAGTASRPSLSVPGSRRNSAETSRAAGQPNIAALAESRGKPRKAGFKSIFGLIRDPDRPEDIQSSGRRKDGSSLRQDSGRNTLPSAEQPPPLPACSSSSSSPVLAPNSGGPSGAAFAEDVPLEWIEFRSGTHAFPFSIPLPSNLPPTLHADFGQTKYTLTAMVHRAGALTPNLSCDSEVTLVHAPDEAGSEETDAIVVERTWEDALSYMVVISGKSFPVGACVPVWCKFVPLAKVRIHRIVGILEERTGYFAKGKRVARHEVPRRWTLLRLIPPDTSKPILPILDDAPAQRPALQQVGDPLAASEKALGKQREATDQPDPIEAMRQIHAELVTMAESAARSYPTYEPDVVPAMYSPTGPWELTMDLQIPSGNKRINISTNHSRSNIAVHHIIKITIRVEKIEGDAKQDGPQKKSKPQLYDIVIEAPISVNHSQTAHAWLSLPDYWSVRDAAGAYERAAAEARNGSTEENVCQDQILAVMDTPTDSTRLGGSSSFRPYIPSSHSIHAPFAQSAEACPPTPPHMSKAKKAPSPAWPAHRKKHMAQYSQRVSADNNRRLAVFFGPAPPQTRTVPPAAPSSTSSQTPRAVIEVSTVAPFPAATSAGAAHTSAIDITSPLALGRQWFALSAAQDGVGGGNATNVTSTGPAGHSGAAPSPTAHLPSYVEASSVGLAQDSSRSVRSTHQPMG